MEVEFNSIKQHRKAVSVYPGWLKELYYNQKELEIKLDFVILSDFTQCFQL